MRKPGGELIMFSFLKKKPQQPAQPDPVKDFFYSLQVNQTVQLLGIKAIITYRDPESIWDDEHFIPVVKIAYADRNGVIRRETFYPRDAYNLFNRTLD
jgi:hypothetical protein